MSYHKIQELAKKFAESNEPEFDSALHNKLRAIVGEMSGDLLTLKYRGFNPKAFHIFKRIYHDVIDLTKQSQDIEASLISKKIVQYVLDSPNVEIINNLDQLAKQHIANSNESGVNESLHPQINSLSNLLMLATQLKMYLTRSNPNP